MPRDSSFDGLRPIPFAVSGAAAVERSDELSTEVFLGRQPIFDRNLSVVGSELLFRDSEENRAVIGDPNAASSTTIITAFLEMGIDSLVGDGVAYLNLPRELLLSSHLDALPADKVVLEILEHVDAEPVLISRVRRLKNAGFTIALDDFVFRPELAPLVDLADIIKIEVLDKGQMHDTMRQVQGFGGALLAEKIEDHADLEVCRNAGFDLFQGYFLCRPVVEKGRRVPQSKLATMRVLAKLCDPSVDADAVQALIRADVGLSVRLLRYLNSAHFALQRPIHELGQALNLLGLVKLRAWISMIAIASLDDKPQELVRVAMVRARMCELLAGPAQGNPAAAFTVGLFSVLDALLDQSMQSVLEKLPLRGDIKDALQDRTGVLGSVLTCVELHERAEWSILEHREFSPGALTGAYLSANRWAAAVLDGIQ